MLNPQIAPFIFAEKNTVPRKSHFMFVRRIAHCLQLLGRNGAVSRIHPHTSTRLTPVTGGNRLFSTQNAEELSRSEEEKTKRQEKAKARKRYALGGCLLTMYFSTHAILLWRRRNEHRALNEQMPPIEWEAFVQEHLSAGRVKSIVFQPSFGVADIYLHSSAPEEEREKAKEHFLKTFRSGPEKFAVTPDVRVRFEGKPEMLEAALHKALRNANCSAEFNLEINSFPSYRELAFIVISTVFTLAAIGLKK
ncbi:hypothetical protein QR680_002294 [Steinernema hermaphroditum]|uniref:Uncharacterized protein n=1 Tax=Steinernema hermaphroditum TaxID=289476 RepID=A0AA39H270_9BILA|nr:hypothetical protein QR680_002294 [Steinernema hermaphroditum]